MNMVEFLLGKKIQYVMLIVTGIIGTIMMNAFYLTELSIIQMMFLIGLGLVLSSSIKTDMDIILDASIPLWYELGMILTGVSLLYLVVFSILG